MSRLLPALPLPAMSAHSPVAALPPGRWAPAFVIALCSTGFPPLTLHAADEPASSPAEPAASAGEPIPAAPRPYLDDDRWHFSVAPYLWGANLNGDVRIGRVEEDVDLGFIDVIKDLSFGGMLYAEARKHRYGAFTNMFFVRTKDSSSGTVDTDVKSDTAQVAVGGFYRALEWQWGETAAGSPLRLAVEPLAGIRWSYIRAEVELSGGPVNLPQADRSESFVDPIIGVRIGSGLSENWLAFVSADVGGFGVGSDYSWNIQGYVGYRMTMFSIPTVLSVGYRALHQKYEDGDFKWDVTQHGPILGMIYTF